MGKIIAGYEFKDEGLLKKALTHSSYANEKHCESNERLEFLGDAVLSLAVSNYLYKTMSKVDEGKLSKIRASLVCEESLAKLSRKLDYGSMLFLGHGEDRLGGRDRNSILSDTFEAVLAAIYLDSDFKTAEEWVLNNMSEVLAEGIHGKLYHDYKTVLQEKIQKRKHFAVTYNTIKEEGVEHNKRFVVEVLSGSKVLAQGEGTSKKEAEQMAAKLALKNMGDIK